MTDNDYIAEYVKEKCPQILGLNFAIWKVTIKMAEISKDICDVFRGIDWSKVDMSKINLNEVEIDEEECNND